MYLSNRELHVAAWAIFAENHIIVVKYEFWLNKITVPFFKGLC